MFPLVPLLSWAKAQRGFTRLYFFQKTCHLWSPLYLRREVNLIALLKKSLEFLKLLPRSGNDLWVGGCLQVHVLRDILCNKIFEFDLLSFISEMYKIEAMSMAKFIVPSIVYTNWQKSSMSTDLIMIRIPFQNNISCLDLKMKQVYYW